MIYDEALDAQQRLFVMRGQSEKLQSDQKHLERYKEYLEKVVGNLNMGCSGQPDKRVQRGIEYS